MKNEKRKIRAGFTIVEMLVSLAIMGILLTAVALAFDASARNYQQNTDIFKATSNVRTALSRITAQLRTAQAVNTSEADTQCSFVTSDGTDITYLYVQAENKLYLVTNDDLSDDDYLMCDNVTAMTFTKTIGDNAGVSFVRGVQISMTVKSGQVQKTMSAAAVIRRNL